MSLVGNPRAIQWPDLDPARVWVVVNSAVAWAGAVCADYAAQWGIPAENIVTLNLPLAGGPAGTTWDPGSNAGLDAGIVAPLLDHEAARGIPHAVVIGPGVPVWAKIRNLMTAADALTPGATAWGPVQCLIAGYRSFRGLVGAGQVAGWERAGGGAWEWCAWSGVSGAQLWSGETLWQLGAPHSGEWALVDQGADVVAATDGAGQAMLPRGAGVVQYRGAAAAAWVAVGRLGWWGWSGAGPRVAETEAGVRALLAESERVRLIEHQAAPVVVSVGDLSGYDGLTWARLVTQLRDWGVRTEYHYRGVPAAQVQAEAPAPDFAWPSVARPFAVLTGQAANGDLFGGPGEGAYVPVAGGGVASVGPSEGARYAQRALEQGAAWGVADVAHKTLDRHRRGWALLWCLLTGMTVLEAVTYGADRQWFTAIGDPLLRPLAWPKARRNRRGAPGRATRRGY